MRKIPVLLLLTGVLIFIQTVPAEGQQQGSNNPAPRNAGQNFYSDALSSMDRTFNEPEITMEDEYYLGRAVTANILSVYKPYLANPELTRYLNLICQTIVINSSMVEIFNGYHVMILDSPEFNAFASPGGHILLTRGLVELATSEDMLAAVIAHELAHIMLKHGSHLINDMELNNEMTTMANKAADLAGRNTPAASRLMNYRNSVSAIIDTMMKNGYSQDYEYEADLEAVKILASSGYDPLALRDILKILQQVQSSQPGGFNTTHPSPKDRLANLETVNWLYRPQDSSSRAPRFMKEKE